MALSFLTNEGLKVTGSCSDVDYDGRVRGARGGGAVELAHESRGISVFLSRAGDLQNASGIRARRMGTWDPGALGWTRRPLVSVYQGG